MPSALRRAGAELTLPAACLVVVCLLSLAHARAALAEERPDAGVEASAAPAPPLDAGATTSDSVNSAAVQSVPVQEVQVRAAVSAQRAASDSSTGRNELALQPRLRAEQLLEAAPGLITVQHSGGGKAQQYFLRGFDADHGTDIAFSVDGVPINAVSHAHGQGYSDLHFIIPETIGVVASSKGPYSARVGDFSTAGSVDLRVVDHVDESLATGELGPDGHKRLVVVESPGLDDSWKAVLAAEVFSDQGHFIHPESFRRLNALARATRTLDERSEISFTLMAYGGTWNASGVLPARAVCGEGDGNPRPAAYAGVGCLSRWDSIDPSQGGASQRFMAATTYRWSGERTDLEISAFAVRSSLQLFLDDALFADKQIAGSTYGSGTEQDDARTEVGATVRTTTRSKLVGIELRTTVGLQVRDDSVDNALHRQRDRVRLETLAVPPAGITGPIVSSRISETETGAYAEEEARPAPWLRLVLGARVDRVDVAVDNASDTAINKTAGSQGGGLLSPKAAAIVSPVRALDLFANYGRGFHSNDARGVVDGDTLLAVATGYELGAAVRPMKGLSVSAVAFLLDLTSELVFNGDTATTQALGATRRYGMELTARYHFRQDIYADAAITLTHARFRDETDGAGTYVPLAPPRTFAAGIGAREPVGPFLLSAAVRVKSIADRPANNSGSLTATGFTLLDLQAGVRWRNLELTLEVLNLTNTTWREGQFEVTSRLPNESKSVDGVSFTPGWPREAFVHATVYW